MIYLLNGNKLPWGSMVKDNPTYELSDFLQERLDLKYTKMIFDIVPKSLRNTIKKIFMLGFEDDPPYDLFIGKL